MAFSISNAAIQEDHGLETASLEREFVFSDADFQMLAQFAHEKAGISLSESKRNLVYGRLSRRLRSLGHSSFREYRAHLLSDSSEVQRFINAISTNLTKFFRESHHFKHFEKTIAVPLVQASSRRLRVWSAGCSTGEEPYTIAAVIARQVSGGHDDIRILATDVDTDVLATASRGEYPASSLEEVPGAFRQMFMSKSDEADKVLVADEIRDIVRFRHLNLIEAWPFKGMFDAIFCRNVMIYFDTPTKTRLLERFAERLKPGGWLYIGHSESLTRAHPLLELEGKTIYRRRA
jgi:chemotaxis protein methyltransferase CheR